MAGKLNRIDLEGADALAGVARAEYVAGRLDRGREGDGPAFEVHVHGDPAVILRNVAIRHTLERIAGEGPSVGVALFFHGPIEVIGATLSARSPILAAAIAAGGAVRHVLPGATDPSRWSVLPGGETEGDLYSASLSAEIWGALIAQNTDRLARVFAEITEAGARAGGPTQRRLLSDALRRAADCVLPGAGGMHGGMTFCPLCLGSPVVAVDEIPSHLLLKHVSGASVPAAETASS